jgi:hypothetical protein
MNCHSLGNIEFVKLRGKFESAFRGFGASGAKPAGLGGVYQAQALSKKP